MVSVCSHLSQEGWEYRKQGRRRLHYPHLNSKHHSIFKPHGPPNHHRRRSGKGSWKWRWSWRRGSPRKLRDPLELLTTTSESSLSDIELPPIAMPSGFENSAMKSSFSLSSLPPSSDSLEVQHVVDRQYSSLRKKPRREESQEHWRRSWTSREDKKDEFWAALENNYHYLMESNLIDTCKEAGQDLAVGGSPTHEWSFQQFSEQFTELSSWLDNIQEAVNNRRLSRIDEMQQKSYKRKLFNNQSGRLVARSPELKDEVAWRVSYLNSKWERLEQLIAIRSRSHDHPDLPTDIEHELRCLRTWIKETEKRLQPLDFRKKWTLQELEDKSKEHESVQKDVWLHGKVVCWVVKLCEGLGCGDPSSSIGSQSLTSWVRGRRLEPTQAASYARGLERRWQLLYLQTLEWQCHIDALTNTAKQQGGSVSVAPQESDEEPVIKHPRLTEIQDLPKDEVDCLMETGDCENQICEMEVDIKGNMDLPDVHKEARKTPPPKESTVRTILGQTLSPGVGKRLFLDGSSKFNSIDRNGPNCATFYFRHQDTDTEPEIPEKKTAIEESSEEDATYSVTLENSLKEESNRSESLGGVEELPEDAATKDDRIKMITKLFEEAEEMILEEVCASPSRKSRVFEPMRVTDPQTNTKFTRVKEWLLLHPESKVVGDSCDASSECTEDDSMGDMSEGGLDTTLVGSEGGLDTNLVGSEGSGSQAGTSTPDQSRVVLRARRPWSGPRPWSVSGPLATTDRPDALPHSISESAIHQLTQTDGSKIDGSANNVSTLSSSTVEESAQTQDCGSGGGYSSNSLRRRKVKLRKRSLMRKSDSGGSDKLLTPTTSTLASPLKLPALAKLSMRRASADKALLDSPLRRYIHTVPSPSSSGTESEENESENSVRQQSVQPAFRLGPAHTLCSYASDRKDKIVSADSSFSEQAWDNYQEKYMSEAYSEEAPDSESARKLLEFGDDYRNFLDSQSDCASSLGPTPMLHRRRRPQQRVGESDSELDDVWHLVRQSSSQLSYSEKFFSSLCRASPHLLLSSDFAEVVTTCKENISVLSQVLEKIEEGTSLLSLEECKEIRELIGQWERLEKGAEDLQRERSLKREMAALRDELLEIATRSTALAGDLEERDQLDLRIQEVKGELTRLRELNKTQLFQVNLAVHRFITDSANPQTSLKDQVADLYILWDDTYHRSCGRLRSLEEAGAAWQQFESHLVSLQLALRGDQEALKMLHSALQDGSSVSPDLASSLRDIAKLLSEKQENENITSQESGKLTTAVVGETISVVRDEVGGSTEGSLSDSGISDSGSEQELSEREKRLSGLRRLVRHLEAVLAPNSQAIINMSKRLEMTEHELRGLQQTCRELIVKTAVCVEAKGKLPPLTTQPTSSSGDEADKKREEVKGGRPRLLVRVLRAALPFHLALVALFCIACLLQPSCCDSFNNLNLSLTPQLRYLQGPPPI